MTVSGRQSGAGARHARQAGPGWLPGLLAGCVSLAVLWAVTRVERSLAFPPLALAELAIRATPGGIATFFIEQLDKYAIRLLGLAATLVVLVLGAVTPRVIGRARARASGAAVVFGVALLASGLAGNAQRPVAGVLVVSATGTVVFLVVLVWLLAVSDFAHAPETDQGRRAALWTAGVSALGFLLAGTVLGRLVTLGGPGDIVVPAVDRAPRPPTESPLGEIRGLSPEVTSARDHYVVDVNLIKPVVDAEQWTLAVDGLVDQPLKLDLADLERAFEVVEDYSVLTCISNEVGGRLVGNSAWTGIRLGEVLEAAELRPQARDLLITCTDGYTVSVTPAEARHPNALLAIGQNAEPLTVEHGFPCRLRLPQLYGMMNAKWIERIEAVDRDVEGFWARRGWSDRGVVRTQSRIDVVTPAPRVGRPCQIAGVAWAGDRGVRHVDVSVDGGRSWRRARMARSLSAVAWRQWAYEWTPSRPGGHEIVCRAADGSGEWQDARRRPPHPAGATGLHRRPADVKA